VNRRLVVSLALLAALLTGGAAYLARRRPAAPPEETEAPPFHSQEAGAALLLRYVDETAPLRALRWLPPSAGGHQAVQITTQTDRQRVALFENGSIAGIWTISRPDRVGEGFFRFAELVEAIPAEGTLILFYRAAAGSRPEASLVLALDRMDGSVRWAQRSSGAKCSLQPGSDGPASLWCFGPGSAPQRIDLKTGQASSPLTLPAEIQSPGPLVATRAGLLLMAHGQGLSVRNRGTWLHHAPLLEAQPTRQTSSSFSPAVATSASRLWWHARPDLLVPVKPDGSLGEPLTLTLPEPWDHDVQRFHLLGADLDGHLWFDLMDGPKSALSASETGWQDEGTPSPETAPVALVSNAPRVYRFDPTQRRFDQCRLDQAWKALQIPIDAPGSFEGLSPAGGAWGLTLPDGGRLWIPLTRLPLSALPLQPR